MEMEVQPIVIVLLGGAKQQYAIRLPCYRKIARNNTRKVKQFEVNGKGRAFMFWTHRNLRESLILEVTVVHHAIIES